MPAFLIDGADAIQPEWLEGKHCVGVTAGASAPEVLVAQVVERLLALGGEMVTEHSGRREKVVFSLPRELQDA